MDYNNFIEGKIAIAPQSGFKIDQKDINDMAFPHQKDIIQWAIQGGRRAVFASFGLGKTIIQLEICRMIIQREGGNALIICPLGVKQEFTQDAVKLGLKIQYVRNNEEVSKCKTDIMITNYERVRDGKIETSPFTVVSLDEASILRGYGTKTYQEFLTLFPDVPYRYVCTATPSPNKYKELIHYAGFLGIMDTGQALTRFFQRDSTKANALTLYPGKERDFWLWMASWACFLTTPSDLGYSDEGYVLPEMNLHVHKVEIDHTIENIDQDGQMQMFRDAAMGLRDASREKRLTLPDRILKMVDIVNESPDSNFIIWHDLEAERHAIKKALPETKEIYGSLDLDTREERVIDFATGKIKYLATKPKISGSGCNFQHYCNDAIFLGIGYKFNDFIQAIHRIYRFMQKKSVNIHIIYAESEEHILQTLFHKWENHKEMVKNMTDIIHKYGLTNEAIRNSIKRSMGVERLETKRELYTAVNNDCVAEITEMKMNSVDLICTSIPFGNHYEYSANYNDFGHNENNGVFFEQMDYLTPQLLRVLKPGRVAAIHTKDRVMFGNVTGYGMPSIDPFHAETLFHFRKHGFIFFGMITIETDVVRENNQTYRLGWTEQCKDGSKMGVGCPEYLLLFRKLPTDTGKAYADTKVDKTKESYTRGQWQIDARAKWNSSGNRFLTPEEIKGLPIDAINRHFSGVMKDRIYDYKKHVDIAKSLDDEGKLPATFETLKVPARKDNVWSDINRMNTLNANQTRKNLQNHICPLQFDIVERVINRFSSKDELVMDPFAGIMTVPYMAIKLGRKGLGIELSTEYYKDGLSYLEGAENEALSPTLFDIEGIE